MSKKLVVRYGDFAALVRDLRAHGLTNALSERSRTPLRRDTLAATLAHYRAHHSDGTRLRATFETITLTGWAPHESQQQPLKPASAKTRLADALGTLEQPAGGKGYFRFPETWVKKVDNWVPMLVTPATMTIEIRLAIIAYSMAVAPCTSRAKLLTRDRAAWG